MAKLGGHEANEKLEEATGREKHGEGRQRDQTDFHRTGARHRLHFHQDTDRVLPFGGLPERDHGRNRTDGGGGDLEDEPGAVAQSRQLNISPKQFYPGTDCIAHGEGETREPALNHNGAWQQAWREGGGEEQRAEQNAERRE
jgi:hypothetical protein